MSNFNTEELQGTSRGRPSKAFEECSQKTKRRRVEELVRTHNFSELNFAAEESARLSGITKNCEKKTISSEKSLALCLDLGLSERKYLTLRRTVNNIHKDCFPSLYQIRRKKIELLPKTIISTECMAEVNLQDLLNNTCDGLLKSLDISTLGIQNELTLTCKYGFDGSSGHSTYKQKFDDEHLSDEYMFLIAMSPIELSDRNSDKKVWSNSRSSSTFFCRPIKFLFAKETAALVKDEEEKLAIQIRDLEEYSINFKEKHFAFNFKMILTMLDGSAINVLSDTNSTQKCFICGALPKEMNSLKVYERPIKSENLRFGLSSLHLWIRGFELLLHISYRLPLKCWQVRTSEHKIIFQERKKHIQFEFKKKLGLAVDKPKPGYGSTNDGNTSRTFFKNPEISSLITGIDINLIRNLYTIIRIVNSGCFINIQKFKTLLDNTFKLYVELYDWYYMPSSIHKLLVHAVDIINNFDIPIGKLSEDALEARHKEARNQRLYHTRKSSRTNSNKDLLTSLLLTSDPYLASLRKPMSKKADLDDIKDYLLFLDSPELDDEDVINFENIDLNSTEEESE